MKNEKSVSSCSESNDEIYRFQISAEHHHFRHAGFKNGIWYGCVDGRPITAPYHNKEAAECAAISALTSNAYMAHLQTHLESKGATQEQKEDLIKRIEKYKNMLPLQYAYSIRQEGK